MRHEISECQVQRHCLIQSLLIWKMNIVGKPREVYDFLSIILIATGEDGEPSGILFFLYLLLFHDILHINPFPKKIFLSILFSCVKCWKVLTSNIRKEQSVIKSSPKSFIAKALM
jgi:hypothetical protein